MKSGYEEIKNVYEEVQDLINNCPKHLEDIDWYMGHIHEYCLYYKNPIPQQFIKYNPRRVNFVDDDFHNLNLSNACLIDGCFICCEFNDCNFNNVKIFNCIFENCIFNNTSMMNANINNSTFKNTKFNKCSIHNARFINDIFLQNDIKECFLDYSVFNKTNLNNSQFHKASLTNTEFIKSSLGAVVFNEVIIGDTSFEQSSLTNTKFIDSTIIRANLHRTKIINVNNKDINNVIISIKDSKTKTNYITGSKQDGEIYISYKNWFGLASYIDNYYDEDKDLFLISAKYLINYLNKAD